MIRTPQRRRECANRKCGLWFEAPHTGNWPVGYCSPECHRAAKPAHTPVRTSREKAKPRAISTASTRQRVAVMEHGCLICTATTVHPAHLIDKAQANDGQGDPRAVVPLCAHHHRLYDTGSLDILGALEPRFRPQLAYAVERYGLLNTLQRVTNTRWCPAQQDERNAA